MVVIGGMLTVLVAVLAPQLATLGPLRRMLLGALAPTPTPIECESVSAAWWSPLTIRGLRIQDLDGELLLQADEVRTGSSLLDLVASRFRRPVIVLDGLQLDVRKTAEGSNLRAWLAAAEKLRGEQAERPERDRAASDFAEKLPLVSMRGGVISVVDEFRGTELSATALTVSSDVDSDGAVHYQLSGELIGPRAGGGGLSADLAVSGVGLAGSVEIARAPLALAELATAAASNVSLEGFSDLQVNLDTVDGALRAAGSLTAYDVSVAWPSAPRGVVVDRIAAPFELLLSADAIDVRSLQIASPIGSLALRLQFPLGNAAGGDVVAALSQSLALQAELDLAAFAVAAPDLAPVRQDVRLTDAVVRLTAQGAGDGVVHAKLATERIAADTPSGRYLWEAPLTASVSLKASAETAVVESLAVDSDFLVASGGGDASKFETEFTCDLNRLADHLAGVADLANFELAGRADGRARWLRGDGERDEIAAQLQLAGLAVSTPQGDVVREPELTLDVAAEWRGSDSARRLNAAQVRLAAAGDSAQLTLTPPAEAGGVSEFSLVATGDLARWRNRFAPFAVSSDIVAAGAIELSARGRLVDRAGAVDQLSLLLTQLDVEAADRRIVQSRLEASGSGSWSFDPFEIRIPQLNVEGQGIGANFESFSAVQDADGRWVFDGRGAAAVDLARLEPRPGAEAPIYYSGVARVDLATDAAARALEVSGWVNRLAAVRREPGAGREKVLWQEPRPEFVVKLKAADGLQFEATVNSQVVGVQAVGEQRKSGDESLVKLEGKYSYDLETIAQLRPGKWREIASVRGKREQSFSLTGRLAGSEEADGWNAWRGQGDFGWDGADVLGVQIGPAVLTARLQDGVLAVDPLAVAVNSGEVRFAPQLHLAADPPRIVLPAGRAVENVAITPETCARGLKFVSPLLAEATEVQGAMSLDLAGGSAPLGDPNAARLSGTLTIHAARIRPGPLAKEIIRIAQQVEAVSKGLAADALFGRTPSTLLEAPEQQTRFVIQDGRVYHDSMQLRVGDVAITTQGSVGFDETLAINVSVPIQEKWLREAPRLAFLAGEIVRIPVRGTLRKYEIDTAALEDLNRSLIGRAAEGLLRDELLRGLDRLLKP